MADMGVSPATGDALSNALPNEPATTSRQTLAAKGFDARASETVSEADALPSTAPDELVECTALEKSTPTSTPCWRSNATRSSLSNILGVFFLICAPLAPTPTRQQAGCGN